MTHPSPRLKLLLAFAAGLAAMQSAGAAFAQIPPPPTPRMITVSGEAEGQVAPDRAILTVSLVNKNAELTAAKRANDEMVEKLVVITRNFKIPKEKIATSNLYISPEYRYDKGKQHFIGYVVSRTLRVTMDQLSIHERVLSAIVEAGVDQVNGVEFTLADEEAHAKDVRVKAVENARQRAEALASAAGTKLGRVMSISTVGSVMQPPMPVMGMAMRADMAESSVAPSLPGMITLHESVTVSFELE